MTESREFSREEIRAAILIANAMLSTRQQLVLGGESGFRGQRQYNVILGYPDEISLAQYTTRYYRQDIAGRLIDLPATDTWKLPPLITDGEEEGTDFTKGVEWLVEQRKLWSVLTRADRISGIGRYGGIFIGIKDGKEPSEEAGKVGGPEGILFLRPFGEASCTIKEFDVDTSSERFGLPKLYELEIEDGRKIPVHHSRIFHIADNRVESEWEGIPRLQRVWNRLDDLYKVVGGAGESSWLNMRPGTVLTTQPGYDMDLEDEDTKAGIQQEIEEYAHGILRFLTMEGVDVKQLAGQILDPSGPFDVIIALISASSGIPQRVLLGSAAGELAAAQEDTKQWHGAIRSRQANYAEPEILRPLLDYFVVLGALTPPSSGGYEIEWESLTEESDADKAGTAETWAKAVNTMGAEVSNREKRELLGLPKDIPEDMEDPEPEEPEPEPDAFPIPTPDELDAMEPVVQRIIANAEANFEAGLIEEDAFRGLVANMGEW